MSVEDDRIEQLKRKLYSRDKYIVRDVRAPLRPYTESPQDNWQDNASLHLPDMKKTSDTLHPFLKKLLIGSIVFFIAALAVATYMFFGGGNSIASSNVDIKIVGPVSVASGEPIDLGISLINQNSTDLKNVQMTIVYPNGAQESVDTTAPLTRTVQAVGTIKKGSVYNTTNKLVLFGEKGEVKTITFGMSYTLVGSNATFTKEKKYDVSIGSSPVIMTVSVPTELNSGQQFDAQVTVTSNSTSLLKNVLVKAEFPYGFTYKTSSITPQSDNTTWNIGDLKNGDKKTFTITGSLVAQDNEERTFRFMIGNALVGGELQPVLSTVMPTVTIKKPFFDARLSLNGDTGDVVGITPSTRMSGALYINNTLSDVVNNLSASIQINGSPVNDQSVIARNGGFYQSSTHTMSWDQNVNDAFIQLGPGAGLSVSFDMNNFIVPRTTKNPEITLGITVSGSRALATGGVEPVSSVFTRKLRFITDLVLTARSLRSGSISNTGPVPPVQNQASTYTVEWTASNTINDVTNTQVQTQLPAYIDWTNTVSPSTENITYNSDTRTITWKPGTVSAGSGFTYAPKKVSFQVRLNASASQAGTAPQLTGSITSTGTDVFAGKTVTVITNAPTSATADGVAGVVQ